MKKLILILAMACMLGGIAIGVMNKGFLEKTNKDLADTRQSAREVGEELDQREDERKRLVDTESVAKDERNKASAAVDEVAQNLRIEQRKIDDQKNKLESIEIEQREIQMAIDRVFPDGNIKSPDELRMVLTMLEDTLTSNQNRKATLQKENSDLTMKKTLVTDRLGKEEQKQIDRKVKIALGSLIATVVAVNNDWGFVMVNAGTAHGVEPDAALLVKRGNVHVARLRLLNVQENVSVCDVVPGTLSRGVTVNVGDKVIFENPFR